MPHPALKPVLDESNGKWRLNIPARLSQTGKRQRLWFERHSECLGAAKRLREAHRFYGYSHTMLAPARLTEAAECFALLEKVATGTSSINLKQVVIEWLAAREERLSSPTLDALFSEYLAARQGTTHKYRRALGHARRVFEPILGKHLTEITHQQIERCLAGRPDSTFNLYLTNLIALLNHAVRKGYVANNVAVRIDRKHSPLKAVEYLPNEVVRKLFAHAQDKQPKLIPFLTLTTFCGIRPEGEMTKLLWSDIKLDEKLVVISPQISKTRRRRLIPLSDAAVEWLRLSSEGPPSERVLSNFTTDGLRSSRRRAWREIGVKPPAGSIHRKSFASNYAALHSIDELTHALGHSTSAMTFARYAQTVSRADATDFFFNIRPVRAEALTPL
jgi:integrase